MEYTLQQLRYLIAVADHGSISSAARALRTSQPGVSTAVSHLEEVFAIQCFVRHHAKGISLTPAGRSFVAVARNLVSHAEDLHLHANDLNQSIRGNLNLGCFSTIGCFFLPRILKGLRERYPDIHVQITEGDTEYLQDCLRNGLIELSLLYDLNLDPSLTRVPLVSLSPYALFSKDHKLAARSSVNLNELVKEPLILFDRPHSTEYLLSLFATIGERPYIKHRTGNFELVRSLVAGGHGYAILNLRPMGDMSYDGSPVVCLPIEQTSRGLPVVLAAMANAKQTRRATAFAQICMEIMAKFDLHQCVPRPRRKLSENRFKATPPLHSASRRS